MGGWKWGAKLSILIHCEHQLYNDNITYSFSVVSVPF